MPEQLILSTIVCSAFHIDPFELPITMNGDSKFVRIMRLIPKLSHTMTRTQWQVSSQMAWCLVERFYDEFCEAEHAGVFKWIQGVIA